MITKSTTGLTAGFIALALFGAACTSASGPEVVAPTNAVAESADSEPNSEDALADEPAADTEQNAEESTPASETDGEAVEDQSAIPAPEALQFTAPLVGGGEIDLAAGFDNKPTVFWFWAPN